MNLFVTPCFSDCFVKHTTRVLPLVFLRNDAFYNDEDGMQTIGVVMLIAITAVMAIGIWSICRYVVDNFGALITLMLSV